MCLDQLNKKKLPVSAGQRYTAGIKNPVYPVSGLYDSRFHSEIGCGLMTSNYPERHSDSAVKVSEFPS